MRKLVLLLVGVAIAVTDAEAVFLGRLNAGAQWTTEIINSSGGEMAVTVTWVRHGSLQVEDSYTIPAAGQTVREHEAIPRNVSRIIIVVDPPPGGQATLRVNQGPSITLAESHNEAVFDVVPAP